MDQINNYIQKARQSGMADEQIKSELVKTGWQENQVQEALEKGVSSAVVSPQPEGSHHKKRSMMIGIAVIAILVVGGGAFASYYYFNSASDVTQTEVQSPSRPTPEPPKGLISDNVNRNMEDDSNMVEEESQSEGVEIDFPPVKVDDVDKLFFLINEYLLAINKKDADAFQDLFYEKPTLDLTNNPSCLAFGFGGDECADFTFGLLKEGYSSSPIPLQATAKIYQDDKQAIIYSSIATSAEYEKGFGSADRMTLVAFRKDNAGDWKIVRYNPLSVSEVPTLDSDEDGLFDHVEKCEPPYEGSYLIAQETGSLCEKSDPNNPDTNGDGLWDGVEFLMKYDLDTTNLDNIPI